MKLTIGYDTLMGAMTYVHSVSTSSLSLENNRTIVFDITDERLAMYGESTTIGVVTEIPQGLYQFEVEEDGVKQFQVKTKELINFLSTFTVDRTHPTDVEMTLEHNQVHLVVHEEPLEDQPSYLKNASKWVLDLLPIKASTKDSMEIGKGEERVGTELLSVYISTLFPLLSNQDSSMNDSRVNFEDEYVNVITSKAVSVVKNRLPSCLRGIVIGYSGMQLLKQLGSEYEEIYVSKDDEKSRLYISAGNNRIAIKFNRKMVDYKGILENIEEDNYIVIDRQMFLSVLKRLKLTKDKPTLSIDVENEVLKIENSRFQQDIPLTEFNGSDLGTYDLLVLTDSLSEAVLGGDMDGFEQEIIINITKMGNHCMIAIKDKQGFWLSVFRVTIKSR